MRFAFAYLAPAQGAVVPSQREKAMKNLVMLLPAIAVLGACHSQSSVKAENASVAEVAAVTKDAVKLQPGKWQTTIKILSVDAPGMPAQMGAAMKQQMSAAGSQTVESCLTPEMVAKPPENMFAGGAQNCTYEKFSMSDGKMDATLVCKGGAAGPGEMRATMSGNFASTSYDVTSDASMNMPAMPGAAGGGKVNTKTQVIGKRVGECDAKKTS
ncbi:MAG: DUF3617 domain-containing protein [Candidatus Sphingomonas phytovorans]|nr:DUF3617 domain-containing protein [Sphingomonas sp.]WEK02281.1 MAG: DUF3617 domain-containing protein [Sphingomonas sp.]